MVLRVAVGQQALAHAGLVGGVAVLSRKGHNNNSAIELEINNKNTGFSFLYYNSRDSVGTHEVPELVRLFNGCAIPVAEGPDRNVMSASSCFRTIYEAVEGRGEVFHAPGPRVNGRSLPGGYPVRVEGGILTLAINDQGIESAIQINQLSLEHDGIKSIGPDAICLTEKYCDEFERFSGITYDHIPLDPVAWEEMQSQILQKIDFRTASLRPQL